MEKILIALLWGLPLIGQSKYSDDYIDKYMETGAYSSNVLESLRGDGIKKFLKDMTEFKYDVLMQVSEMRENPEISVYKASLALLEKKNYRYALGQLLALKVHSPLKSITVARIYLLLGEFDKALSFYNEVPKTSQLYGEAAYEKALLMGQQNNVRRALGELTIAPYPKFYIHDKGQIYLNEAHLYSKICRFGNSDLALSKAIKWTEKINNEIEQFKGVPDNILLSNISSGKVHSHEFLKLIVSDWRFRLRQKYFNKLVQVWEDLETLKEGINERTDFLKKKNYYLTRKIDKLKNDFMNRLEIKVQERRRDSLAGLLEVFEANAKARTDQINELQARAKSYMDMAYPLVAETFAKSRAEVEDQMKKRYVNLVAGRAEIRYLLAKNLEYELIPKAQMRQLASIDTNQHQNRWKFENEYWIDELGGFVEQAEDQCTQKLSNEMSESHW